MTSDELSQEIANKDNEILGAQKVLNEVQEAQFKVKKTLVELNEAVRKGKYNLARMKVERQLLEREYWTSRGR